MNMGMGSADPSMSRCHYEYQAIPGTQIPPFLPYFAPLGYQQVTDARLETRSDHRSSSHRSDQACTGQVNQANTRQLELHLASAEKLATLALPPAQPPPPLPLPHSVPSSTQPQTSLTHTLAPSTQPAPPLPHTVPPSTQPPPSLTHTLPSSTQSTLLLTNTLPPSAQPPPALTHTLPSSTQ
ncbi:hypothetical protein OTU49_010940, partial [Cherax quadricarinatus]